MTILADGAVHPGLAGGDAEFLVIEGGEVTVPHPSYAPTDAHRALPTAVVDAVMFRERFNPQLVHRYECHLKSL